MIRFAGIPPGVLLATALGVPCCWAAPPDAQDAGARAAGGPEQVVITGAKAIDQEVTKQVETALHNDPYVDDSHITVSVRDGVVTLEGIVVDTSDLRGAILISNRVPGAKRVVDDLELHRMSDD